MEWFFDINTIFFTLLGYPMSYIEFFGTIFTGASVLLAAKNKISTWWVSIIGIILYGFLFYQINLYSDLLEQAYYLVTAFLGWYLWSNRSMSGGKKKALSVSKTSKKWNVISAFAILSLSVVLGLFMTKIHIIFPTVFPDEASLPYLDSFTTIMSFVATIYLVRRKIESWYLWIVVDIIGVWLYYTKGVPFLSVLYFAFLINAFFGYFKWKNELKES